MSDLKNIPAELFTYRDKEVSKQDVDLETPSLTFIQDAFRRLKKNKVALFCAVVLIIIIVLAFAAPWIAPNDPNVQNIPHANLPPKIPGIKIHGLDGFAKLQGKWFDKYTGADIPELMNLVVINSREPYMELKFL